MKTIGADKARKRLAKHLTECEESGEPLCIRTQKAGRDEPQLMVIISKAQYDIMQEQIKGVSDD